MPRKTLRVGRTNGGHLAIASMRPRPDAAENAALADADASQAQRASMRPRPDAAENAAFRAAFRALLTASMRPRPDAAENPAAGGRKKLAAAPLQ